MHASASCSAPWPFVFMGAWGPRGRHHRHGPPPWVAHMAGMSGGAEKGEIRYLILDALTEGPAHGYAIIGVIERKSAGAYRPSPGSIYPTLQMLEEMGHVSVTDEPPAEGEERKGGRKVYAVTDAGRADLAEHAFEVEGAYDRLGSGTDWTQAFDFHTMGHRLGRLMRAIGKGVQAGWLGTKELREIQKVVEDAATRIEQILTENRR